MKSYVITIQDQPKSVEVANRCILSGKKFGVKIEKFDAITPKDDPIQIAEKKGIPLSGFKEIYSRFENCLSAFLSHYSLWEMCAKGKETFVILEHDAVFVNNLPNDNFVHLMNIGKPSYGKANVPPLLGVNDLTSKAYLPGAHAYMLKPAGAKELIQQSKIDAGPTDIFIHKNRFFWIKEYYPWPVEAKDTFTTIQKKEGCLAKHHYSNEYQII